MTQSIAQLPTTAMIQEATDRVISMRNTVSWWNDAHHVDSWYHQRFGLYCPFCSDQEPAKYRPITTPRLIAAS